VVNTETGVAQVDRRLIETARSFMANERQILLKIILPSALPYIIAGMRLGIGRTLVMVVVAEIYAATKGLGYLIFQAGGLYDTAQVFVGVVILAAAGMLLNAFLRWLEKKLAPWQHVQAE
jgi:NitT/TauT family transport system permease protein